MSGRGGGAGLARGPGVRVRLRARSSGLPGARFERGGKAPAEQRPGNLALQGDGALLLRDFWLLCMPGWEQSEGCPPLPAAWTGVRGFRVPEFSDSLWGRAHPPAHLRRFCCCHWDHEAEAEACLF